MNRQCRICLDINDPRSMLAPCNCRGTSEFIHRSCLKEYIRHFPDGVCRVCRKRMIVINEYEIALQIVLFFWLSLLICFANIPFHTKLFYTAMLMVMFFYTTTKQVIDLFMFLIIFGVSYGMVVIQPEDRVKFIIVVSAVSTLVTIFLYIPPQYILLLAVIGMCALYGVILTIFLATTTDSFMTSYFIGFLAILWNVFIHARPPLDAIN